jgi:hypothetical protein
MRILHDHNVQIAGCYAGYAAVLAAKGDAAGAAFYALIAFLHALAARPGDGSPPPGAAGPTTTAP